MTDNTATSLMDMARNLASEEGMEIVDLEFTHGNNRSVIRVFIHRPGGITIQDCQNFSKAFDFLIEAEGILTGSYLLEVSSPGLTRPLKKPADFSRTLGELIEVHYYDKEGKIQHTCGRIIQVTEDTINLESNRGEQIIPLEAIKKAKPIVDWSRLFKKGDRLT